tara:strand:+ start:319 stop:459 length:141 start_codon:yes stop_codon:yes gene_type:complete
MPVKFSEKQPEKYKLMIYKEKLPFTLFGTLLALSMYEMPIRILIGL